MANRKIETEAEDFENTVQVTIRVPYGWLKRADQLAIDLAPAGKKLTRMDGFRAAIATGFEQYENKK